MEDTFSAKAINITTLFGSPDSLFQVPDYQRPYSWEDEEVQALWEDIYDAFKDIESNPSYFLGSLITIKPGNNKYHDIVDGQQRLTTLTILFCVIRDLYPDLNQETDINKNHDAITSKLIKSFIHDINDRDRLSLKVWGCHENDFKQLILKEGSLSQELPKVKEKNNPVTFRFLQTAQIFKDKLQSLQKSEVEQFVNYLGNCVKIVKITCNDQSFAVKLFQVLNHRGQPLENSDLIKSDLISRLPENRRDAFMADWHSVEETIKNFDYEWDIEDMFTLYVYYLIAKNPKKDNYEEIKNYIERNDKDSNEVINDFKGFCELYKDKISCSRNKTIHCLNYLNWAYHWKAILMTALKKNFKDFDILTFEIRRFYYLNWLAGKNINTIKQISFSMIKDIKDGKDISSIKQALEEKLKKDSIYQLALNNLASPQVEKWIKPLLLMLEYKQIAGEELDYIEWDSKLQLEHILPKGYMKNSVAWGHISDETARFFLNSIGNLTLLGGSKNITAGNKSFAEKVNIYSGNTKQIGKQGITPYRISQKIADDFNKGVNQWDREAMENRWNWFLDELKDALRVDISPVYLSSENTIEKIYEKNPFASI